MEREELMDTFFLSCMKALLVAIGVALLACATGLMAEGQENNPARPNEPATQPAQEAVQQDSVQSVSQAGVQTAQPQSSQPPKNNALPDAPEPQTGGVDGASTQAQPHPNPITKRILWILPNFRTVPGDERLPAQSTKEKFMVASRDSFDYSSMIVVGFSAGFHDFRDSYPEFGHGMSGYGQYYWHSGLDSVQENYLTEFVFPTLFHQDTRYYLQGKGGFWKRGIYAVSRAIITRSDAGNNVFNSSEILGTGVAAGLSDLYYPSRVRTVGHTMQSWGINIAMDAIGFGAKEFGQDVERKWFHKPQ